MITVLRPEKSEATDRVPESRELAEEARKWTEKPIRRSSDRVQEPRRGSQSVRFDLD